MRLLTRLFLRWALVAAACSTCLAGVRHTGPWNLGELKTVPPASWGPQSNSVREVYYQSEPFQGKRTWVFAYYARPAKGKGPFPAMLLVHGGGGKAFKEWAEHWARRGYVALAMDTAGHGPEGRLPQGGPEQDDATKFRDFAASEANQMWTYHAVAAVIRGHSLLAARKEVDPRRIGITGISWGGYLTCIIAGLDDRLKAAVPVYGCGFLNENSYWTEPCFAKMTERQRTQWVENFDPSQYLPGVNCPIFFLNGSTDFAYPLDSYQKSYRLVRGSMNLCIKTPLPHGHIWTFGEVDTFIDSVLKGGLPLPKLKAMKIRHGKVTSRFSARTPVKKGELHYTCDTGPWQKRVWKTAPVDMRLTRVSARLPDARPLVFFLSITDKRGLTVTAPHQELTSPAP